MKSSLSTNERAGLLEDDQHALRGAGDLPRATGTWQAHFGLVVVTDHGGVDIAETVDLGRAEKPTSMRLPCSQ